MKTENNEKCPVLPEPLTFGRWRKSTRSDSAGNCVEVAKAGNGNIGVRDSKDPAAAVLIFTPAEWEAFIGGVRLDEFTSSALD